MELLLRAFRDFDAEADSLLAEYGLGRAHHRAIYFIGRHPGISVGDLIILLGITKQSLGRVLTMLLDDNLVDQRPAADDRRRRLLTLTESGQAVEKRLTERQRSVLAGAYRQAGAEAVVGFRRVLAGLCADGDLM